MRALIAAALVVTAVPVAAAASQENGVTVEAPKQVCRRMEVPASGSRISRRRVCMTAAQWRARNAGSSEEDLAELDALNRDTLAVPGGSALQKTMLGGRLPQ